MMRPAKSVYSLVYLLLLALLTAGSFFLPDGALSGDLAFEPDSRAKIALDVLLDLQQFVGTLNTGLFAACGVWVAKPRKFSGSWGHVERVCLVGALAAGAMSYYGLYLSRVVILEMVSAGVIDPLGRRLQFALGLQYYGFLVGIILLGLVFVRQMDSPQPNSGRN
jgi:hypothetical protein